MRTVYLTDGSKAGFFTAVFEGYSDENAYLTANRDFQPRLFDTFVEVKTDEEKAKRVLKKLYSLSLQGAKEVDGVLRSEEEEKEQTAFSYVKLLVKYGASARNRLTDPIVRKALDSSGRVWTEAHRMKGFLRFMETETGVLYAPFSPDNDIVELIMPHFARRLQGKPFLVHDTRRKIAGAFNGTEWILLPAGEAEIVLSDREEAFASLWKKYYRTVSIPTRPNARQQKNYMPVRYWGYLTERPWEE